MRGSSATAFWQSWVLAGAESDEVILRDVHVPDALVFYPDDGDRSMDPVQARGFLWFELLIAAAYVGAASGLVERVLAAGRGSAEVRATLAIELEAATLALEQVAASATQPGNTDDQLAHALYARYGAERAIERASMAAAEAGGGMAFVGSSDVAYLIAASRALAFHPPSLAGASEPLIRHLTAPPSFCEDLVLGRKASHGLPQPVRHQGHLSAAPARVRRRPARHRRPAAAHFGQVRWSAFVLLFVSIDVIGYLPGAIAWRRAPDRRDQPGLLRAVQHHPQPLVDRRGRWRVVTRRRSRVGPAGAAPPPVR